MKVKPTGREQTFDHEEIIVSKTCPAGRITYANDVFLRVSGYTEAEVLGAPHSLIRHPDMPRAVFKLLWDTLATGQEIFAYVLNMAKNGDHYWVLAHVTPTFGANGQIVGYHSNRRTPDRTALETIAPLYRQMLSEEAKHVSKASQMEHSGAILHATLGKTGMSYAEFIFSLSDAEGIRIREAA